jgi:hypothetical protein
MIQRPYPIHLSPRSLDGPQVPNVPKPRTENLWRVERGEYMSEIEVVETIETHPLDSVIGSFGGEIWEELLEDIARDRQEEEARASQC